MLSHGRQPRRKLELGGHGKPMHAASTAQSGAAYTMAVEAEPMLASSAMSAPVVSSAARL